MKEKISKLKKHFILCGYGRVGQAVAQTFRNEGTAFVVVDPESEPIRRAAADNCLYLQGDATSDEVLRSAGIHQARRLVATTGSDASNMYIILSARELAPELLIITRACAEESKSKLERAGANRVINPYYFGGQRMARLALHPLVIEFIETALHRYGQELVLEGIEIMPTSPIVGKSLGEAQLYSGGASILAITKVSGDILSKPSDETIIEPGDKLVILGTREQLRFLEGTA